LKYKNTLRILNIRKRRNPFEDEGGENAENAGHAGHDNLRTNHSIDDEFNPGDFFDDMDDERAFEALYS
jgi:hypothetical protein